MDQEPPYSLRVNAAHGPGLSWVCCYYFKKLWPRWRWGWLGSGPLVVCRSWRQQWQHGMRERVVHGDRVSIFVRLRWGRRWEVRPWTWAVPLKASVGTSAPQIREVPGGHLWPRPSPHPLTPCSAEHGALSLPRGQGTSVHPSLLKIQEQTQKVHIPVSWAYADLCFSPVLGHPFSHLTTCRILSFVCFLSCVQLFATPWTAARQLPLSMGFPRQES